MPEWLDSCVKDLLGQGDFYPKRKDRESLAYAICQKQHKSKSFPMRITKATIRDGGMYFQGVVSDDDWDYEDERLDISIFHDFQHRLDAERHKADYEPPFVGLSHYGRFRDRSGERGVIEDVWNHDGIFKADGWFNDDPLSKWCFEVVRDELERSGKGEKIDKPVRFSIAFLPEETTEEGGRTVYLKGILDHVALTRVPVNPRTGFTQVTEKSMTTKREDALSIVGEDAPEEVLQAIEDLDEKQHTEKSQAEDLVIKADEETEEDSLYTIEQDIILRAMLEEEGIDKAELEEKAWSYSDKKSLPDSAFAWVEHGEGCAKADGKTPQSCRHLPYKDKSGKADCPHVRAALQAIGGARSGKKMSVPAGVQQKLRGALKGCQGEKAEILEVELTEYESGRVDGFNAALDMDIIELPHSEVETMTEEVKEKEAKASLDSILAAVPNKTEKPEPVVEEQKAEVIPPDELDTHLSLLRQILAAEGEGRARKLEGAEAVLRSLAVHVSKTIDETTPPSPEDVANTMKSQLEEVLRPVMDKMAVLEAAVLGKRTDAPVSKALSFEQPFNIPSTSTIFAAQGNTGEMSSITKMVNRSCGLPEDSRRQTQIL